MYELIQNNKLINANQKFKTYSQSNNKSQYLEVESVELPFSNSRKIIVCKKRNYGNVFIDVREYDKWSEDQQFHVTKKGLFFKIDELRPIWNQLKLEIDRLLME